MHQIVYMQFRQIIILLYLLLVGISISNSVSCKSKKGKHVQMLAEAKQIQKSLIKSGVKTKEELQKEIDRVEVDKKPRWKISTRKKILVESIESYRSYKNPSENRKYRYEISNEFDIILKPELVK